MNWASSCAAVIPCQNEEATIAQVVRGVRLHLPVVLVVNDCSHDETAAQAVAAGAQVLQRSQHPGKGAAIRAGLTAAADRGCTWAITLDGDGQHLPEDIPRFQRCVEETGAPLVIGNRMDHAEAIPWLRRVVNRWMSHQLSKAAGRGLPDSQCGFRLMNLKACATLRLETDHFEIESEVSLAFVRGGYRVEFVPIQVVGRGPQSHIKPLRDTWRWLRWWARVRLAGPSRRRTAFTPARHPLRPEAPA